MIDFELLINFLLAEWFLFLLLLLLLWVFFGDSFSEIDTIWLSGKLAPFGMGRISLLSTFISSLFFKVLFWCWHWWCRWNLFLVWDLFLFVCFMFSGNSEPFFERYISSSLDACSNKEFICWSLAFIFSLRSDTWSSRWFINFSEWLNGVLVIGASGVSTSLFNNVYVKNAYVRLLTL